MPVSVNVRDGGKAVEIAVTERFDFNAHQDFRAAYENNGSKTSHFIIDLGGTEYMDSSALGMLLVLREYCGGASANISIANASQEIRKLLEIANYEKLFKITDAVT